MVQVDPQKYYYYLCSQGLIAIIIPGKALAAPNPIPDVDGLPGWTGNVTVALMLASFVEETTYYTSCMVPGSQWFNSRIAAPAAAVSVYVLVQIHFSQVQAGTQRGGSVWQVEPRVQLISSVYIVPHLMTQY